MFISKNLLGHKLAIIYQKRRFIWITGKNHTNKPPRPYIYCNIIIVRQDLKINIIHLILTLRFLNFHKDYSKVF